MNRFFEFIKKPKNLYFSIVAALTLVVGLSTASFSYYVPETNIEKNMKLADVDVRMQSDNLEDGYLFVPAGESIDIEINVMSNNDFTAEYEVYYTSPDDVDVLSEDIISNDIEGHSIKKLKLSVANFSNSDADVNFYLATGYNKKDLVIQGKRIAIINDDI